MVKIGILGYGNLGRGVEAAIKKNADTELVAVYTRRDPSALTINTEGVPVKSTDDWCFEVKDGIIVQEKVGGEDCWQMVGISYWSEADGHRLSQDIADVYAMPGGKERYWEQVPLVLNSYIIVSPL